jgi:hypothetical protein
MVELNIFFIETYDYKNKSSRQKFEQITYYEVNGLLEILEMKKFSSFCGGEPVEKRAYEKK